MTYVSKNNVLNYTKNNDEQIKFVFKGRLLLGTTQPEKFFNYIQKPELESVRQLMCASCSCFRQRIAHQDRTYALN